VPHRNRASSKGGEGSSQHRSALGRLVGPGQGEPAAVLDQPADDGKAHHGAGDILLAMALLNKRRDDGPLGTG
jgi:hypothetical protein